MELNKIFAIYVSMRELIDDVPISKISFIPFEFGAFLKLIDWKISKGNKNAEN